MGGRPSKPVAVIEQEGRSHRTKAELEARRKAEEALATGQAFREKPSVKNDEIAHKEFLRLRKLLIKIEKNDALFENIINRYCELYSECEGLKRERESMMSLIDRSERQMEAVDEPDAKDLNQFMTSLSKLYQSVMRLDGTIAEKRKMLLTIERETCMTVAAQLRTIPKTEEKQSNPLLEALKM